ncbi:MAG: HD domain-containing protein [Ahrensia sp.]
MKPDDANSILSFLREAEALKDVLRSGHTASGKRESTAEHSWRLCLAAIVVGRQVQPAVNMERLLQLCIIHDLGELYCGDTPAIDQTANDGRDVREAEGFARLIAHLPAGDRRYFQDLFDDYNAGHTPEAKLAKGLDKLETILQHTQGKNAPDFDYGFNLDYGRQWTDLTPEVSALRALVDGETERLAGAQSKDA